MIDDQAAIEESLENDPLVETELDFVLAYTPTLERAAKKELKGSRVFDRDDLMQEAWLAILPYWKKLHEGGEGLVYTAAATAMRRYAAKQRVDYDYFSGRFIYTPEVVKTQLELGAWESTGEGDWDIRLDVHNAYEKLDLASQGVVDRVYKRGESINRSERAELSRLDRAIEKMANILNEGAKPSLINMEEVNV